MDWHPIESAPKDGTWILAYWLVPNAIGVHGIVQWSDWAGEWIEDNGEAGAIAEPTHWMPLPKPPSTSREHQT